MLRLIRTSAGAKRPGEIMHEYPWIEIHLVYPTKTSTSAFCRVPGQSIALDMGEIEEDLDAGYLSIAYNP